jgi:hypothetical protein
MPKQDFFLTANNYLGLGPVHAQAGDKVHILSGAQVPFILRQDEVTISDERDFELDTYTMVGDTCACLMKGEALKRDSLDWGGNAFDDLKILKGRSENCVSRED